MLQKKAMSKADSSCVDVTYLVSVCQRFATFQGTPVIRITMVVGSHPVEWAGLVKTPRPLRNRPMGRSIHVSAVGPDMTSVPAGNASVGFTLQQYN